MLGRVYKTLRVTGASARYARSAMYIKRGAHGYMSTYITNLVVWVMVG